MKVSKSIFPNPPSDHYDHDKVSSFFRTILIFNKYHMSRRHDQTNKICWHNGKWYTMVCSVIKYVKSKIQFMNLFDLRAGHIQLHDFVWIITYVIWKVSVANIDVIELKLEHKRWRNFHPKCRFWSFFSGLIISWICKRSIFNVTICSVK